MKTLGRFNIVLLILALTVSVIGTAQTTLRIGRAADVRGLNAMKIANNDSSQVTYQIHEGLVTMSPEQNMLPVLATSWELLDDDLTWRIYLREGVTFHSGAPFTAADVKWNFDKTHDPDDPGVAHGLLPEGVATVVDDYTIDITLNEPNGVFMNICAAPLFMMVEPARYEALGEDYGTDPSGTGPFKYNTWIPGERVILDKYDGYWGAGAEVDQVIFEVIPDPNARVIALENGEIDMAFAVAAEEMDRLEAKADLQVYRTPSMRVIWVALNTVHPMLTPNVRKAIAHATDKDKIMPVVGGNGVKATGIGMPTAFGFKPCDWEINPDLSRALLEADGWMLGSDGFRYKDGEKLTIESMARGTYVGEIEALEVMQILLLDVGIDFVIVKTPSAAYRAALDDGARAHDEEGIIPSYMTWTAASGIRTGEIGYITERAKTDQGFRNYTRYNNPEFDLAFNRSQAPGTDEERLVGYHTMADLFHFDVIRIPIFVIQANVAASANVEGFVWNGNDSLNLRGVSND